MPDLIPVRIIRGSQTAEVRAVPGTSLLDLLRAHDQPLHTPCGGRGTCRKCRVILNGRDTALACQYFVNAPCTVEVPTGRRALIQKAASEHIREVAPDCGIRTVTERGLTTVYCGERILTDSRQTPGLKPFPYGLAVDIGTTTVVVHLMDLSRYETVGTTAFLNPQAEFWQDVISRIHYSMENARGLRHLQQKILDALNNGIGALCADEGIAPYQIFKAVFAANTTMLHLLLGVDPRTIALAPFTPAFTDSKRLTASDLGLSAHPEAAVITLPSVSGYVGADITAGLTASPLPKADRPSLFIDLGTNGEMAIGNRSFLLACSTAAGPAFEGARIECGVGGIEGAISKYRDNRYETLGNARPIGICGSGLIDIVANLLEQEKISPEGLLEEPFVVAPQTENDADHDIVLTPRDVRETQLAKGAVAAGIRVMLKEAGLDFNDLDKIYLAGGFGSFIDIRSAVRIGLLPRAMYGRIVSIGNAAGAGARLSLISRDFERQVQAIRDRCRYIELSGRADFNDFFMDEMVF
ncbi:MAG: ASKHA domain-containing protein [Fibrobacterota bacterium]